MIETILALGLGFLLGSLPCGFWLARAKGVDIRKKGSGNIGATNVGRILGKEWGYLVFALDALKGWLAVWLAAEFLQAGDAGSVLTGMAAVAGHVFSPWLEFKGGKGVATSAGVLLGLAPAVLVATAAVWGISGSASSPSRPCWRRRLFRFWSCGWSRAAMPCFWRPWRSPDWSGTGTATTCRD